MTERIILDYDNGVEGAEYCDRCECTHTNIEHCGFDPERPCRYCTRPVTALSMGGYEVCPMCDVGPVPYEVFVGKTEPYDFWTITPEEKILQEIREHLENEA